MQQSLLKNSVSKFALAAILMISVTSCGLFRHKAGFTPRELPEREKAWARSLEAQYPHWERPIMPVRSIKDTNPGDLTLPEGDKDTNPPKLDKQPDDVRDEKIEELPDPDKLEEMKLVPDNKAARKHTVKKGETLSHISKKYYGKASDWKKILKANNLKSAGSVKPGQVLVIP